MSAVADEGRGNAWVATPVRGDQDPPALRAELARIDAEAARDQRERNDPGTRGMVEARDFQAAGGRFDDADSTQRLIDAQARRAAERAEVRAREDRETDARHAVQRFPFWHNDGQQERGPTDRPGVIERAHAPHRMQGQTRDRGHAWVSDRAIRAGRGHPPITRGRGLDEGRQR